MPNKLNEEQLKAVNHKGGPLLIIAGAGTGKTTVVTERILHLVKSKAAKPSEILALTFTEKAAAEMQERVDVLMPYGYTQMWISTFHGFCDRVLRDEALAIGLTTDYSLLTKPETIQFVRKNLYEFDLDYFRPIGNPTKFIDGLVTHFSRLQDEDISPEEYQDWVRRQNNIDPMELAKWKELAGTYQKFEDLKDKSGYLDFGDLIAKTLQLFKKRPNVLASYQDRFKYILVDEFQDTNYAQFELSTMLAGNKGDITVVADDDQSIYRFRGASVSNVLQFRDKYPKAEVAVLTKNYRTFQEILDAAHRLIQNNNPNRLEVREAIDKKLVSQRKGVGEIRILHENRVENEAERVVKEILSIKKNDAHAEWKDFAVLVRANAHADPFLAALKRNGIPSQFLGPGKLFLQPEILELTAYLKVLTDSSDSAALYQVLSMPELKLPEDDLSRALSFAKKNNKSLYDALKNPKEIDLGENSLGVVKKFFEVVGAAKENLKSTSPGKLLYDFLTKMEIMSKFLMPQTEERQRRTVNIGMLFERIKSYESAHPLANAYDIVDWIELSVELGDSPKAAETDWAEENAVNILTIHSAKGLEFPVVFLVNLVDLRFPSVGRRDPIPLPDGILKEIIPEGDVHLQEERRLFYVGMTRARDKLFFTAADFYGESASRTKKMSPFIFEALGELAEKSELPPSIIPVGLQSFSSESKAPVTQKSTHHVHYLSYSQIETFKMCPMHYKLRYILGIPTPPSGALVVGSAVHSALKDFYEDIALGHRAGPQSLRGFLDRHWTSEGFISLGHEKAAYKKAESMLDVFYKQSVDLKNKPVLLERQFTVPLTGKSGPLKIGGVIDRVDELSDGGIEIIDYKTGATVPSQKEVDRNMQLSLYALAATKISEPPFAKLPNQIKLTLWYLDENVRISTFRTKEQLEAVVQEVFDIRDAIEKSDFKCSNHPFCESCEYKNFCRQVES